MVQSIATYLIIQLNINHLFTHSKMIKQVYLKQFSLACHLFCTQFKCCCIVARATSLPVSRNYKRRRVSQDAESEVEREAERQLWKDAGHSVRSVALEKEQWQTWGL